MHYIIIWEDSCVIGKHSNLFPKTLTLSYRWSHSTYQWEQRVLLFAVIPLLFFTHTVMIAILSIGRTSYCRRNNKIMTWWQIYFTAKACCRSPLISLFLFFLPVILHETNKTDTFNDKQTQGKDTTSKSKQHQKNCFAKILQVPAVHISKIFKDLPLIKWRMNTDY